MSEKRNRNICFDSRHLCCIETFAMKVGAAPRGPESENLNSDAGKLVL